MRNDNIIVQLNNYMHNISAVLKLKFYFGKIKAVSYTCTFPF